MKNGMERDIPHRLKGKDIPFEARIVAIVDVFDALIAEDLIKIHGQWSERYLTYTNKRESISIHP